MPKIAVLITTLIAFIIFTNPVFATSQEMINEIYYDPSGGDSTLEFLELYNSANTDICIGGWDIQIAGTSFSTILTIPDDHLIRAKSFYLIAGQENAGGFGGVADLSNSSLSMQNGGNETDGVRIRDADNQVIDTLLYDEPNTNNLPDDTGGSGNSFAVDVSEGHSLQRKSSGVDTDKSGDDFADQTTAGPQGGGKGSCPVESSSSPSPTQTSSTQTTSTSTQKSPTPTPKPSSTGAKSSQPSPLKSPNSVLGERTEEQLLLTSTPESSPVESPNEEGTQNSSKTKIAAMFAGSGIILIGLSIGFFVLYNRVLNKSANEEKKEN